MPALAVALASWLGAAAPAAAQILWGANGHPITAYPGIPIAEQIALMRDLGMTSYRVNISSAEQADHLGAVIAAGRAGGVDILPVLTPGLDLENETPEALRAKSRAFARTLARRFGADVPVWELGNELEVQAIARPCDILDDGSRYPCDWGPASGTGALDYIGTRWAKASAVLRGLAEGVRAEAPGARLAMGTAGWGHTGAFERMLEDGLDWDISVWHLYGEDPEPAFDILARYGRPIWVTEFNHPLGSQDGDQLQALGLRRMMARLEALAPRYGVEAAHVYELLDEPYWAPSFEAVMGLVRLAPTPESWRIGELKPAYGAVREAIRRRPPYRDCDPEAEAAAARGAPTAPPDPAAEPVAGPGADPGADGGADRAAASADDAGAAEAEAAAEGPALAAFASCLALDRPPAPEEAAAWAEAAAAGPEATAARAAAAFDSPAFRARHLSPGLEKSDFVALLYRLILGREPDPHGLAAYAGGLATGALEPAEVAGALLASPEFAARHPAFAAAFAAPAGGAGTASPVLPERDCDLGSRAAEADAVGYAYCLVLGRDATAAERARLVAEGAEGAGLVAALILTPEFETRYAAASLSDAGFVALVFELLLARPPDGAGLAAYAEGIGSGAMTRLDVARAVLASTEGAARHAALAD